MRRIAMGAVLIVGMSSCFGGSSPELATTTVPETSTAGTGATPTSTSLVPGSSLTTSGSTSTTQQEPLVGLHYALVADRLPFPVLVVPGNADFDYLATKDGRIWELFRNRVGEAVIDISADVRDQGERGLLGAAIDPNDDDRVFVHYSSRSGATTLEAISLSTGARQIILTVDQPAGNHNGGMVLFGPDGYLYLGLGDGGGADDRFGNGQRKDTVLATILRLDVDAEDLVPPDNPFVTDGHPLVWVYGLRNPWRFWFDGGLLYIGDVGQRQFEEIDIVAGNVGGLNFGWPTTEGFHCFSPSTRCDVSGLTLPVVEITHGDAGTCSVTGGVVLRDPRIPEFDGHYFYSDWCGGYLRSFKYADGQVTESNDWTEVVGRLSNVSSFGVGRDGAVFVLTSSEVYRIDPVR